MENVFVQKNSKKIDANIVTLDSKNRDIMNDIQHSEDIELPILEKEKESLKEKRKGSSWFSNILSVKKY